MDQKVYRFYVTGIQKNIHLVTQSFCTATTTAYICKKNAWHLSVVSLSRHAELDFLKSLWGLGTEEEEAYRTGSPGYIGWRNSFLGVDSGAPYTFKNTGSERKCSPLPSFTPS
jgi:hypothetical protein